MKQFFIIYALFLSSKAFAKAELTQKTFVTCQQADGDQWLELGVTPYLDNTYRLSIILHNDDDGSAQLRQEVIVSVNQDNSSRIRFINKADTVKLTVDKKRKTGRFMMMANGPESLRDDYMNCFFHGEISWDVQANPQPRMSVGN